MGSAVEIVNGPERAGKDFDAQTFLAYLRRSNSHWITEKDKQPWVYRGHGNASWKLVPSAVRDNKEKPGTTDKLAQKIFEYLDSRSEWGEVDIKKKRHCAYLEAIHCLVREFVLLANDLAMTGANPPSRPFTNSSVSVNFFDIPINSPNDLFALSDNVTRWLSAFDSLLRSGPPNPETALAQHHGIETLLLDWSYDPISAAVFALDKTDEKLDICVWALNTQIADTQHALAEDQHAAFKIYRPPNISNAFMFAQQGLFTFLVSASENFWTESLFPAMEDLLENLQVHSGTSLLRKIVLKAEHVNELRRLLQFERLTKAHLMPTFDNVAQVVKQTLLTKEIKIENDDK